MDKIYNLLISLKSSGKWKFLNIPYVKLFCSALKQFIYDEVYEEKKGRFALECMMKRRRSVSKNSTHTDTHPHTLTHTETHTDTHTLKHTLRMTPNELQWYTEYNTHNIVGVFRRSIIHKIMKNA